MSKLQTVKITVRDNVYGGQDFAIVTVPEGHMVRSDIGSYAAALEIAERIDTRNTDPECIGWGGLELS